MRSVLLGIVALAAVGCGGGSSIISNTPTSIKFDIAWPDISRTFNAPKSADRAFFYLFKDGATAAFGKLVRGSNKAAFIQHGTTDYTVSPGLYNVEVDFQYGDFNGVIAFARLTALVNSDGTLSFANGQPLGAVTYGLAIDRLNVVLPSAVFDGRAGVTSISGSAPGSPNVAVDPASVTMMKTGGTGAFTIDAKGVATVTSPGSATVQFASEGITSAPVTAQCYGLKTSALNSVAIAHNPTNGRILATTANPSNSVVEIDPATLAVTRSITTSQPVAGIYPSHDGQTAYVAFQLSPKVMRIDLTTFSLTAIYDLSPSVSTLFGTQLVQSVAVSPTNPGTFAAVFGDGSNAGGTIIVFDGDVARPSQIQNQPADSVDWIDDQDLIATTTRSFPSSTLRMSVDPTGVTLSQSMTLSLGKLTSNKGLIYGTNGMIADPTSLTGYGYFGATPGSFATGDYDFANRRALFLSQNPGSGLTLTQFDSVTRVQLGSIDLTALGFNMLGASPKAILSGPNGRVFATSGDTLYAIDGIGS